jgi:hypothetical protein
MLWCSSRYAATTAHSSWECGLRATNPSCCRSPGTGRPARRLLGATADLYQVTEAVLERPDELSTCCAPSDSPTPLVLPYTAAGRFHRRPRPPLSGAKHEVSVVIDAATGRYLMGWA